MRTKDSRGKVWMNFVPYLHDNFRSGSTEDCGVEVLPCLSVVEKVLR